MLKCIPGDVLRDEGTVSGANAFNAELKRSLISLE